MARYWLDRFFGRESLIMEYCQYHPLSAATYRCESCMRSVCDDCSDEQTHGDAHCFYCKIAMTSLGDAQQAEPFWRRLEQSFKYPVNMHSLVLISVVSTFNTLFSFLPLAFIWQLVLTAAMMSYCFACLEQTSKGKMTAPDITTAYEGGFKLLLKLFGIFTIAGVLTALSFSLVGIKLGLVLALISISCIPAGIILLSVTDDFLYAMNPLHQLNLMTTIGVPYGLLLCFILMMSASVGTISSFILFDYNLLLMMLVSAVSNFYMVVMFHIMGYMIYQYQDSLGFSARADYGDAATHHTQRSEEKRLLQQAEMALKDGEVQASLELLIQGVKRFPSVTEFKTYALELLLETQNIDYLDEFGAFYLEHLIETKQDFQLTAVYKRIKQCHPTFQADKPEVRFQLAKLLFDAGDFVQTVTVLNGIHKAFPEYAQLSEAFELMSKALEHIPGKETQAEQAMKLSRQYALPKLGLI